MILWRQYFVNNRLITHGLKYMTRVWRIIKDHNMFWWHIIKSRVFKHMMYVCQRTCCWVVNKNLYQNKDIFKRANKRFRKEVTKMNTANLLHASIQFKNKYFKDIFKCYLKSGKQCLLSTFQMHVYLKKIMSLGKDCGILQTTLIQNRIIQQYHDAYIVYNAPVLHKIWP